jgi:hypothetical protein
MASVGVGSMTAGVEQPNSSTIASSLFITAQRRPDPFPGSLNGTDLAALNRMLAVTLAR